MSSAAASSDFSLASLSLSAFSFDPSSAGLALASSPAPSSGPAFAFGSAFSPGANFSLLAASFLDSFGGSVALGIFAGASEAFGASAALGSAAAFGSEAALGSAAAGGSPPNSPAAGPLRPNSAGNPVGSGSLTYAKILIFYNLIVYFKF